MLTNEQVKEALEKIANENGGTLRPADVVNAARDPEHPLHERFQWDDAKAGEAHRLDQARSLIKSVKVEITTTTRKINAVAYVHDPSLPAREPGYVHVAKVRSKEELAREHVAAEVTRLASTMERTRDQAIAAGVPEVAALMDRLLAQIAVTLAVPSVEPANKTAAA